MITHSLQEYNMKLEREWDGGGEGGRGVGGEMGREGEMKRDSLSKYWKKEEKFEITNSTNPSRQRGVVG